MKSEFNQLQTHVAWLYHIIVSAVKFCMGNETKYELSYVISKKKKKKFDKKEKKKELCVWNKYVGSW